MVSLVLGVFFLQCCIARNFKLKLTMTMNILPTGSGHGQLRTPRMRNSFVYISVHSLFGGRMRGKQGRMNF